MDMYENYLSQRETVRKYWNTQNRTEEDKYLRTLKNWEHIYLDRRTNGGEKRQKYPLKELLKLSGIARSTYYYHLKQGDRDKYEHLKHKISEIFKKHRSRYGKISFIQRFSW